MRRRAIRLGLIACALAWGVAGARAIEPETSEGVVLHNRVWDGFAYVQNFVPSNLDEFYLLADRDSALAYVQTIEYFWPLARRQYVGFDTLRVELEGTLRISEGGRTVSEASPDFYSIVYPEGAAQGDGRLVWGEEATEAYDGFRAATVRHNRLLAEAEADRARYHGELREAGEARVKGLPVAEVRPPAEAPTPLRLFVSEPAKAFRLNLAAGSYELALYRGALYVEGSRHGLEVLRPAITSATTVDVIPEERWTRVLTANTPGDAIFARPGATLYLALGRSDLFDDREYARLVDPQEFGQPGREKWVRRGPASDKGLEIRGADGIWAPLTLAGYKVRQTRGADLGYVIEPGEPGETPDLMAFALATPESATGSLEIRVVDPANGLPEAGGVRRVVFVGKPRRAITWGLAALPLAFGISLLLARASRNRPTRETA